MSRREGRPQSLNQNMPSFNPARGVRFPYDKHKPIPRVSGVDHKIPSHGFCGGDAIIFTSSLCRRKLRYTVLKYGVVYPVFIPYSVSLMILNQTKIVVSKYFSWRSLTTGFMAAHIAHNIWKKKKRQSWSAIV